MSKVVNVRALLTGQVAENTILMYEESWKKYIRFAACPIKAMDAATLVGFRQHLIVEGGLQRLNRQQPYQGRQTHRQGIARQQAD